MLIVDINANSGSPLYLLFYLYLENRNLMSPPVDALTPIIYVLINRCMNNKISAIVWEENIEGCIKEESIKV